MNSPIAILATRRRENGSLPRGLFLLSPPRLWMASLGVYIDRKYPPMTRCHASVETLFVVIVLRDSLLVGTLHT